MTTRTTAAEETRTSQLSLDPTFSFSFASLRKGRHRKEPAVEVAHSSEYNVLIVIIVINIQLSYTLRIPIF